MTMSYEQIKSAEARGRARAVDPERADRFLAATARFAVHTPCHNCGAEIGPQEDGDVTMCTRCGQWHEAHKGYMVHVESITPEQAAECAREPMDPYDLLEIMAQAARQMVPYTNLPPRALW